MYVYREQRCCSKQIYSYSIGMPAVDSADKVIDGVDLLAVCDYAGQAMNEGAG